MAPMFPPAPRKPRNKPVMILTIAVVFFVLAAGALGTLWLVEQGNHKGTTSELQTVKDNLAKTKDELKTVQSDKDAALAARQRLERDAENSKPCITTAKAFIRATSAADADKLFDQLIDNC
jgi:uncharacterized protein (DUF3084 family)